MKIKNTNTELIDRYLFNELSEEERREIEGLLSAQDSSFEDRTKFQEEMNLQKEIIHAIRERGLKELLQEEERAIRAEREPGQRIVDLPGYVVSVERPVACSWSMSYPSREEDMPTACLIRAERKRKKRRIIAWSVFGSAASIAVAACLVVLLMVVPLSKRMVQYSNDYAQELAMVDLRGATDANQIQEQITDIMSLIAQGNWDAAERQIAHTKGLITEQDSEQAQEQLSELEWLQLQCYMHDGHIMKARKLMKQIANGDGPYSERAKKLLQDLE